MSAGWLLAIPAAVAVLGFVVWFFGIGAPKASPCGVVGCEDTAVIALRFRDMPGHVHVCRAHEAIDREFADVTESADLPCPWPCTREPIHTSIPTLLDPTEGDT